MKDLGARLLAKANDVVNNWTQDVRANVSGSYEAAITYEAIRSRLPLILQAIAACLSSESTLDENVETVCDRSDLFARIAIRVELGFDIDEMLREFSALRVLIVQALESSLEDNLESNLESNLVERRSSIDIEEDSNRALAIDAVTLPFAEKSAILQRADWVLNSVVADSAKRYTTYQLEQVEPMHSELLASNQALIRLVQMQKDNAAHLAHELKNPLNAITGLSSLLLRKKVAAVSTDSSKEKEIKQVERIYENSKQISLLINNMLEVSRKESQKLSLNLEPVEVSKLVEKVVESLAPTASEKGISLQIACELAPPQVITDSLRLQQIIVNLMSNAIRYTDSGSVRIKCWSNGDDCWLLSVRDTGRGISPAQQQQIFTPYFRGGKVVSYPTDSTGLGLAIVSKLVELLQGEVTLTSAVGKGSTFTVMLPISTE